MNPADTEWPEESSDRVDIVEVDRMTGNDRTMWMHENITREEAESAISWKEQHISGRYGYQIVPTGTGPSER